ncbi:MAG: peptidoglycan-binding domain-containing protein [Alphaproteobacteria bacterium]
MPPAPARFSVMLGLTALLVLPPMSGTATEPAGPPGPDLVAAIQARLAELGYYRGQLDGIVGQMTREAIRRYERQVGLAPTGAPSLDIYRRLRDPVAAAQAPEEPREPAAAAGEAPTRAGTAEEGDGGATPAAAAVAASLSPPRREHAPGRALDRALDRAAEAVGIAGSRWRFLDVDGADFVVTFRPDGNVGDVPFAEHWRWQQTGDSVELRYANRLGRSAIRRGTLVTDAEMTGSGRSSRGREWTWTASRLP